MTKAAEHPQSQRFLSEVEQFRNIARLHRLPTGFPECLGPLPLRFSQDHTLRSSFTELFRRMQQDYPDLTLNDAIWLLLTAIGGRTATTRQIASNEAVDFVTGFVTSIGGWPDARRPPARHVDAYRAPTAQLAPSTFPSFQAHDVPFQAGTPGLAARQDAPSTDPLRDDALAQITQTLARLERSTGDLRHYLDSVDHRLARLEPLLEAHNAPPPPRSSDRVDSAQLSAPPTPLIHEPAPASAPDPAPAPLPAQPAHVLPLVHRNDAPPAISPAPLPPVAAAPSAPNSASAWTGPVAPNEPADEAILNTPSGPNSSSNPNAPPTPAGRTAPRARFAAAMDLPQSTLRTPFQHHPAPEQPLPRGSAPTPTNPVPQAVPSTVPYPVPDSPPLASHANRAGSSATPAESPSPAITSSPFAPPAADPPSTLTQREDSFAPSSASTFPPEEAPLPASQPSASDHPRSPIQQLPQRPQSPLQAQSPPAERPASYPTFGTDLFGQHSPESQDDPPSRSRAPLLLGIVAAFLVMLALALLAHGRPLPRWASSLGVPTKSQPAAAPSSPDASSAPSPSPAPHEELSSPQPGVGSSPNSTEAGSSNTSGKVLGARAADRPQENEQILRTPTYVPELTLRSRLVSGGNPLYPRSPTGAAVHGTVALQVIVATDGTVEAVTVLGGPRSLRDAAVNAVRAWRFQPMQVHGVPAEVRSTLHVPVQPPAQE